MSTLHDNADYKLVLSHAGHDFFMPTDTTTYSKWRELAMSGQDAFSRAGISEDVLKQFAQQLLDKCNKQPNDTTLRSDTAVIATNILLRLREPVDELCAVRMGAIACIHADEDPVQCTRSWIAKKMELAKEHPAIFDFFLHMGIGFTPLYGSLLRGLTAEEYLTNRNEQLSKVVSITS